MSGSDDVHVRPHLRQGVAIPAHVRGAPAKQTGSEPGAVDDGGLRDGLTDIAAGDEETCRIVGGLRLAVLPNRNPPDTNLSPDVESLSGADFSGLDLTGIQLGSHDLVGANFTGADLTDAVLVNAIIEGANFTNANLTGTIMSGVGGEDAVFDGALLAGTDLYEASLNNVSMDGARMEVHNGTHVDLSRADVMLRRPTRVPGSEFARWEDATVKNFIFDGLEMHETTIGDAYVIIDSSFNGANLSQVNFSSTQIRSVDFRNANCRGTNFDSVDMLDCRADGADFSESTMAEITIYSSTFSSVKFVNVRAPEIHIYGSKFDDVDFTGGTLEASSFTDTNLRRANFTNADCRDLRLYRTEDHEDLETSTKLYGSDVSGAIWKGADTTRMDVAAPNPSYYGAQHVVARYDSIPLADFCAQHGLDSETTAVLVWGGMLEVLDNTSCLPATTAIDISALHVPAWVAQNYG